MAIGPMLQKEIRPKLSLEPSLSLRVEERPTPMAAGDNKRNGHRTCRHTAGVKCDCDEISRRRKGEQKQCGIEDTQQQGEAQLENDTQNSDDQKDTDAESDRPD